MVKKLIEEGYTYYLCPVCEDWFYTFEAAHRHCEFASQDTPNVGRKKEKPKDITLPPDNKSLYGNKGY